MPRPEYTVRILIVFIAFTAGEGHLPAMSIAVEMRAAYIKDMPGFLDPQERYQHGCLARQVTEHFRRHVVSRLILRVQAGADLPDTQAIEIRHAAPFAGDAWPPAR